MDLAFSKYEGLGNDFIVVDGEPPAREVVRALCDRHRGVGADGVIAVDGLSMHVVNADGSEPEMCGNGIRCVTLHLLRQSKWASETAFSVQTRAGVHLCQVVSQNRHADRTGPPTEASVRVQMAVPKLGSAAIGAVAPVPLVNSQVTFAERTMTATAVSMGNPHLVVFGVAEADRLKVAQAVAKHEWFPQGVNVGIVREANEGLHLDVLERGAGWTQACGTGACAAAVAAVETGRYPRDQDLLVRLPGGNLVIQVGEAGTPVWMTGPAHRVFAGTAELP